MILHAFGRSSILLSVQDPFVSCFVDKFLLIVLVGLFRWFVPVKQVYPVRCPCFCLLTSSRLLMMIVVFRLTALCDDIIWQCVCYLSAVWY